jgi:tRNA threonylcarbamoyladenosine biosynthesis protein TsaB
MTPPERILAIDVSGGACSTAMWREGRVVARRYRPMTRGHAEALMPMIHETMVEVGESLRRLDAVAVSIGPGAFTGIRIGLAAARGIGLAAAVPTVGISTFAAVAEAVPESERSARTLVVLLDSRRGDLFVQRFSPSLEPLDSPAIEAPEAFAASLTRDPMLLAGDGVRLVRPHSTAPHADVRFSTALGPVDAANVATLAARRIWDGAVPARPLYLRAPELRLAAATASTDDTPPLHHRDGSRDVMLRPLGAFDLAIAAAVHAGSFDDAWTERAIGELLAMPGAFGTLACFDDQPIGIAIAVANPPDAEVLTLGVLPAFRRRGVARRMLLSVADQAAGIGCERLLLDVAEDNEAAHRLYRKLGFMEIARRPAYYGRPNGLAAAATVFALGLQRREA